MKRKYAGAPSTIKYKRARTRIKRRAIYRKTKYSGKGRRSSRVRSRRGNKRKFIKVPAVDPLQLSSFSKTLGKRPKLSLTRLDKFVKAGTNRNFYRFQGVNAFNSGVAYYAMARTRVNVVPNAGSSEGQPLYLFQLTGLPSNQGVAGPVVGWKMEYRFNGGFVNYDCDFSPVSGQDAAGVSNAQSGWGYENIGLNSTPTPGRFDLFNYVDIRLNCIGAQALPVHYSIDIVKFKEACLMPEWSSQLDNPADVNLQSKQIRQNVFENLNRKQVQNPTIITGTQAPVSKYLQVLHHMEFWIQPSTTLDLDSSVPVNKLIHIFKRIDKLQNYAYQQQAQYVPTRNTGNVGTGYAVNAGTGATTGSVAATVAPEERIFLMVRATCMTLNSSDVTVVPSFDLCLRSCHSANAQVA